MERGTRRRFLCCSTVVPAVYLTGCLGDGDGNDGESERPPDDQDVDGMSDDEDGRSVADTEDERPGKSDEPIGGLADEELPLSGEPNAEFEALDEAVLAYMEELQKEAGVVRLRRDGRTVHARGFGWGDRSYERTVDPNARFRIGSISKLFTNRLRATRLREHARDRDVQFSITAPRTVHPDS